MSRIAGIVPSTRDAESRAPRVMFDVLGYRNGWRQSWAKTGVAYLGRLGAGSIAIAAETGLAVVLDGTIYNRAELGASAGESDAALLLSLYRRTGDLGEVVSHVNGDFAIALFDERRDMLWLARDRIGLRPLYYVNGPNEFAFASRPRSLLTLSGVSAEPDPRYVGLIAGCHYRYFDNDLGASPYRGIRQLPPAHCLAVSRGSVVVRRYWGVDKASAFTDDEDSLAERYRALLIDAVRLRLNAVDRPAFTLSGGMDSSTVLSSAVSITGHKQNAYSSVYNDTTYDESSDIQSMLSTAVERWHPVKGEAADVFGTIERMVAAHDEPVATATWLAHFLLCEQAAADGVGTLFGGMGGDELNAGEYEYFPYFFADLRAAGQEETLAGEIASWARHHDHPIFRKSPALAQSMITRLTDPDHPGLCRPDRARLERYAGAINRDLFNIHAFAPEMDHPFGECLANRTWQDLTRETAPPCFRAEDRNCTFFGLAHADPFTDHRLIEFMFRVPGQLKIRHGVTKHLLRKAMQGLMPDETRLRIKKTGWNAPAHVWFSGDGLTRLRDLVASRRFRDRGIYDEARLAQILDEHEAIVAGGNAAENHMMFLWQLVNLDAWLTDLERFQAEQAPRHAATAQ